MEYNGAAIARYYVHRASIDGTFNLA